MAKGANQKRKLLYLLEIFRRETDEEHPMTLKRLEERLADYGVSAERKSLYDDLEQLRLFGADIVTLRGRQVQYYLGEREFDLAELRLLVDAVQSSRFITQKKSLALIQKLEGQASRYQAGQLQQQVLVSGRIKSMNESIYYNVDRLQTAIRENRQVRFQYFDWDMHKTKKLRREGAAYRVSPWALLWDHENYYLVAFEAEKGLRHYRVDRMQAIESLPEERTGREAHEAREQADLTRKTFGMFGGEEQPVTLRCAAWMAGVILDRFGHEVTLMPVDDGFTVRVPVAVSPPFFAWASGFGGDLRIEGPLAVREEYRRYLAEILAGYEEGAAPMAKRERKA